jgi:hypothetical protein
VQKISFFVSGQTTGVSKNLHARELKRSGSGFMTMQELSISQELGRGVHEMEKILLFSLLGCMVLL